MSTPANGAPQHIILKVVRKTIAGFTALLFEAPLSLLLNDLS